MRLLVIRMDGVPCERLLDAERLPAVARLMEVGWHGPLENAAWPSLCAEATRQERRAVVLTPRDAQNLAAAFESVREHLGAGGADLVELTVTPDADGVAAVDAELGATLEALEGETAVLVVSPGAGFVLAAPSGGGERRDATTVADLQRTLLELGGYEIAEGAPGRSLAVAAGGAMTAAEEEQMMRDHLRGLGYI